MSTGDWVTASTVIPFGFHGESKWRKVQQSFFVVNYRVCRTPERENDVLTPGTENLQTPLGALRALSHLRVLPSSLLVARSGTMWRKWRAIGGHVIIIGFDVCSLMLTSIVVPKKNGFLGFLMERWKIAESVWLSGGEEISAETQYRSNWTLEWQPWWIFVLKEKQNLSISLPFIHKKTP